MSTSLSAIAQRRRALRKPYAPYNNAGLTPYISDSFNRTNSTTSTGSTDSYRGATLGSLAWTTAGGATFGINGGALYCPTGTTDGYLISPPISSSVEVRATIKTLTAGTAAVSLVAGYTDINNFVLVNCRGDGLMVMYRRTAGTFTNIGGTAPAGMLKAGDEVALRIEPSLDAKAPGTLVTVLRNGAVVRPGTAGQGVMQAVIPTATQTMGTRVGIREDSASDTTWRVTNLRAYPITPGPSMAKTYPTAFSAGTGEGTDVLNPDVKYLNGQWVMNYSTNDGATRLAYCAGTSTSPPLGPWTREPNNPILVPSVAEQWAFNGSMVALGGTYYLYYQALNGPSNAAATNIATTTSLGGPWTKQGVLSMSGQTTTFDPFAEVISGNTVRLWMLGSTGLIYATSTDGLTFSAPTTVNFNGYNVPQTTFGEFAVFTDAANALHLWWCGGIDDHYRAIHEAVSYDNGANFNEVRLYRVPKGSSGAFDSLQTFDPCPVLIGNTVYCFYAGCQGSGNVLGLSGQIGLAIGPNY